MANFALLLLISFFSVIYAKDNIRLTYFNGKGLAEVSRMALGILGIEFEDVRAGRDFVWKDAKAAGEYPSNLHRLPVMDFNGVSIGQSKPIERLIGRKYGYLGKNDIEAAQIESIVEHVSDIKQAFKDLKRGLEGEELANATLEFTTGTADGSLNHWLRRLSVTLTGEPGFAFGNKLSLADLHIFLLVDYSMATAEGAAETFASYEKLAAIHSNVKSIASDYLADGRYSQGEF